MRRFDLRSSEATVPTKDAERKNLWEWSLTMSVPERAILEMMDELPHEESFTRSMPSWKAWPIFVRNYGKDSCRNAKA